jgi:hypothetical protein
LVAWDRQALFENSYHEIFGTSLGAQQTKSPAPEGAGRFMSNEAGS